MAMLNNQMVISNNYRTYSISMPHPDPTIEATTWDLWLLDLSSSL